MSSLVTSLSSSAWVQDSGIAWPKHRKNVSPRDHQFPLTLISLPPDRLMCSWIHQSNPQWWIACLIFIACMPDPMITWRFLCVWVFIVIAMCSSSTRSASGELDPSFSELLVLFHAVEASVIINTRVRDDNNRSPPTHLSKYVSVQLQLVMTMCLIRVTTLSVRWLPPSPWHSSDSAISSPCSSREIVEVLLDQSLLLHRCGKLRS